MKAFLPTLLVAIFSVFVGSQVTEGVILVPYWQSLPSAEFYAFYHAFGPAIGRFYTVLTIIAAIIPIALVIYCRRTKSNALGYAVLSSSLAILFVASFYVYFKGANASFYQSIFSETDLKNELIIWNYWHWGRVLLECGSLIFLMLSVNKMQEDLKK